MQNRKDLTFSRSHVIVVVTVLILVAVSALIYRYRNHFFLYRLHAATSELDGQIEFYGKVIDHRGNPISGASVKYLAANTMQISRGGFGSSDEVVADRLGEFHIKRGSGSSLGIEWIKKDGYRFATGGKAFSYGFGRISPSPHLPDPQRPVQFLLIPSEFPFETVIRQQSQSLKIDWNTGPVEVPIGETGEVLILNPTRDMKEGERKGFAWSVRIEIKNGSLLMRKKGDILPLAPLDGYQKVVVVGYERGARNWGGGMMDKEFSFKSADGKYGRLSLSFYADHKDGKTGALLAFVFNPTGERFLD